MANFLCDFGATWVGMEAQGRGARRGVARERAGATDWGDMRRMGVESVGLTMEAGALLRYTGIWQRVSRGVPRGASAMSTGIRSGAILLAAAVAAGCTAPELPAGEGGGYFGAVGEDGEVLGADGTGIPTEPFSFFVTSLRAMQELSGSEDGFGGDLRFGETGPGAGLRGADLICAAIAEHSMPGASGKHWRAFLSATDDGNGNAVNAIDRIGEGPWYDRLGRVVARSKEDLRAERPTTADPAIQTDLPNEEGVPNHQPDLLQPEVDNHRVLTGSNHRGELYGASATCRDWTSSGLDVGTPRLGRSWPRAGDVVTQGLDGSTSHWVSSVDAPGCAAGVGTLEGSAVSEDADPVDPSVGWGGGYGAIYCFALRP